MNIIRKIRNEFGHSYDSLNFETESIKERIHLLKSNFYERGEIRPRGIFTNTVNGIMAEIHVEGILDDKIEEKKEMDSESIKKIKEKAKDLTKELTEMIEKIREEEEQKIKASEG